MKGGKREGSGPKPKGKNRVKVNFMLLPEVANYLRNQDKKPSQVIEEIILNKFESKSGTPS